MRAEDADWSASYLALRRREGRLYPDDAVALLPATRPGDPLAVEWRSRADSARRLVAHLARHDQRRVLEVGCGNGWLANRIAGIRGSQVVGIDRNVVELEQARRVFRGRSNLRFVLADVVGDPPAIDEATAVVLASVIQYVEDLPGLLRRLRLWLAPGGEIHLLDSPLYRRDAIAAARARSERYYREMGAPEMARVYRHHAWDELDEFRPTVRYDPSSPVHRLERAIGLRSRALFPWLTIGRD
jgi:SAM-dependent methyltransferase